MQMKQGGQNPANPYMRPMGRSSLSEAPAPAAPAQYQQYTPNEPEEKIRAFSSFSEKKAEQIPQADAPMVILPRMEPGEEPAIQAEEPDALEGFAKEEDKSEETSSPFSFEAAPMVILPQMNSEEEEPEEMPHQPEEQIDFAAAYMDNVTAQQEEPSFPEGQEDSQESVQDMPGAEAWEEEPAYDFDPAYYSSYWQQWQNAMEAHQAETCSACPLMNNQRGKVYFVPLIVPDGTDELPEAVLSLRGASSHQEPAQEESIPAHRPEPKEEMDDEDEDFTGEDAMANEDMPTPQTVPAGVDIGQATKKRLKWPWILLAIVALLAGGVLIAGRLGYLQEALNWLGLPESVSQWFQDIGLM